MVGDGRVEHGQVKGDVVYSGLVGHLLGQRGWSHTTVSYSSRNDSEQLEVRAFEIDTPSIKNSFNKGHRQDSPVGVGP